MNRRISLSEMSKLLNISKHTLRYYDKIELITPSYDSNGYRYYSIDHYYILSTIKLLRDMDVSIKDIKKSLNDDNLEDFVQLLINSKEHIDSEIIRMTKLSNLIGNKIKVAFHEKSCENQWYIRKEQERKYIHFGKYPTLANSGEDEFKDIFELGYTILAESNIMIKHSIEELEKITNEFTNFFIEYDDKLMLKGDLSVIPEGDYIIYYYKGNEQDIYESLTNTIKDIESRGYSIGDEIYEMLRPSQFITSSNKSFFTEFNIPIVKKDLTLE
ncbi:MerR family transcriptional regulator [Vallitalea sediminicola]